MVAIQYYTSEEVAKNNGKINPNIWMIIHNNVYDVTNYMDEVCSFQSFPLIIIIKQIMRLKLN